MIGFFSDQLSDGTGLSTGRVMLYALEIVEDVPFGKAVPELPTAQQEIRVMRAAEPGLLHGECFVNQQSSRY